MLSFELLGASLSFQVFLFAIQNAFISATVNQSIKLFHMKAVTLGHTMIKFQEKQTSTPFDCE